MHMRASRRGEKRRRQAGARPYDPPHVFVTSTHKYERVGFARIEQWEDVWVLEIRGGFDLLQEPLGPKDGGELRPQHFYRHLAVMFEVFGDVDGGHAAGAEFFLDGVAVGEGGS